MPSQEKKGKVGMIDIFTGAKLQNSRCNDNVSHEKSVLSVATCTGASLESICG